MRSLLLFVSVLAALGGGSWAWERQGRAANEQALGAVASALAGRAVRVQCQSLWSDLFDVNGRAADVPFLPDGRPADHTYVTRGVCARLAQFRAARSRRRLDCLETVDWSRTSFATAWSAPCEARARPVVEALLTLAHESMHLRGWRDESAAQCYGIQELPYVALRLGGTAAEGAAAAQLALALQPGMPSDYQSGECRAGGALDLHPETPEFPAEAVPGPPPIGLYGSALAG